LSRWPTDDPSRKGSASAAHELIFGRGERLKIFVSSKMAGGALATERAAVVEAIESFASTMRPWA